MLVPFHRRFEATFRAFARSLVATLVAASAAACQVGGFGDAAPPDGGSGDCPGCAGASGLTGGQGGAAGSDDPDAAPPTDFALRPAFAGPCTKAPGAIDVNLGNDAEDFVRAAYCQVNGVEPPADTVTSWAAELRTTEYVRRIDVVRTFCKDAARSCGLAYTNPWVAEIPLTASCVRKTTRDLGAVMMFWSECPSGVNCGMDWANTHALGMSTAHPLLGFGEVPAGFYNPNNVGFWFRELLDARWAGLQFLLLNVFGPDLEQSPDPLAALGLALAQAGNDVKIGLFDDPWAWGKSSSTSSFRTVPNLADTEGSAQAIYLAKWKPFYTRLAKASWYTFQGRPFIYFYNAGTLSPLNVSSAVVARMKALFAQDFGVVPFVAADDAYFQDPNMPNVADARFTWETLRSGHKSRFVIKGVTLDHFMVKWDTVGRDKPGAIATSADRVLKSTTLLSDRLSSSLDAQVAVIATWNDLGEGTGIDRNYDYYIGGSWRPPNAFLNVARASQCGN